MEKSPLILAPEAVRFTFPAVEMFPVMFAVPLMLAPASLMLRTFAAPFALTVTFAFAAIRTLLLPLLIELAVNALAEKLLAEILPVISRLPEMLAPILVTTKTLLVPATLTDTLLLAAIRTLLLPLFIAGEYMFEFAVMFAPTMLAAELMFPLVFRLPTLALAET